MTLFAHRARRLVGARELVVQLDDGRVAHSQAHARKPSAHFGQVHEVPMALDDEHLGQLVLVMNHGERRQNIKANLSLIAGVAATRLRDLLEAERKQTEVTRDPLTGILNRRGFVERAASALEECRAAGRPMCLAVFDLDHFKRFNDDRGHLMGDEVLRTMGGVLAGAAGAIVGRWGGEEFVALWPEVGAGGVDELFARADRALYVAKESSRDRVMLDGLGDETTIVVEDSECED